ncbi:hypothetical protein TELCIR_11665 [Teladorsagia circumcincta]|uniref:Uncharacterized protein n=1 Tax=Teladorsagia circumcincta TaxID=45464 RepID=A0A2G9U8T5_TELCI|nr:hypothetical protein TELCIR_11665 [Teladorsagia circumcincta]
MHGTSRGHRMGIDSYCGLYVTRGQLVLFDAPPGCIFHLTIDELLVETFRSRDGWQLETSCALARAKAIRRQDTMGHSLLDLGLQFRLSVDIAGGRLKTVSFRVADPTVELSSGVFDELDEHGDSFKFSGTAVENPESQSTGKELFSIEHLSDLCIETNNCLLKYNNLSGGESTFAESRAGTVTPRRAPKPTQYRMLTNHPIEFVMELARHHRVTWLIPSLTFDYSPAGLTAVSPQLTINMDGTDIVTAIVWTWTAASFLFYLPYEFNFAQVFDEFINCIKWIKLVHGMKSTPFKPGGPLPSDFRLVFKEARIELEDDFFENLLQMSHELKEDEVYECERRRQMLKDRLLTLRKANPLIPQTRIDELFAMLLEKNSAIYIERWNKAGNAKRPLFVSKWVDWDLRAFADETFHGTEKCVDFIHEFDPLRRVPTCGQTA